LKIKLDHALVISGKTQFPPGAQMVLINSVRCTFSSFTTRGAASEKKNENECKETASRVAFDKEGK